MSDWPPSLKPIGKFMARAREVEREHPIIAYYCSFHALNLSIQLRDKSDPAAMRFVTGLLEKCEQIKKSIPPDTQETPHRAIVETFALKVFDRADDEDRADRATKTTARTFYAAMCFLEVCSVFGPLPTDLDERLRYAKWKAADITKALREGRRPVPGAPGEADMRAKAAAEPEPQQEPVIPPAPPVEEYDPLPSEAPKYPSSDAPSPLKPPIPSLDINAPVAPPQGSPPQIPDVPTLQLPVGGPQPSMFSNESVQRVNAKVEQYEPSPPVLPTADVSYPAPSKTPSPEPKPDAKTSLGSMGSRISDTPEESSPRATVQPSLGGAPAVVRAPVEPSGRRSEERSRRSLDRGHKPSIKATQEAQKLAKYAASALDFQDVKTAIGNLERALSLLTGGK